MIKKAFWVSLLVFVCLISSLWFFAPRAEAFTKEQKLFLQSWRIVNRSYVDESFNGENWWFTREEFIKKPMRDRQETYDVIEEMLALLDDPFTRLLRPKAYKSLQVNTSGELFGVGLQISLDPQNNLVEVITPIVGSPAESAGIHPRDYILEIDGVATSTLTLDAAAEKMRGPVGTTVFLTVENHDRDADSIQTLAIVRDRITLNPVYANLDERNEKAIGYIRLSEFSAQATQEVAHAIMDLNAPAYILDLRNNPGGLLQAGIETARLWLDDGTIVYTVNRQGTLGSFEANTRSLTDAPLVILVNQGTASASEILSGALQDNGRAVLVGETTYGKGLIQSLFELPDDSGIAVTVAKYETPNHTDINKLGIEPDFVVEQEPIAFSQVGTKVDLQYQKAIELLTSKRLVADAV
ncbi:C-terminal processing peptidase [Xenococcus sp. PCC 7305]|uniref:carboxyl-terminal processing protease CtpA n=1 Tax=Xenococcus sp. PCC 7305 TaxID=102125 RepID=UPI0002ABB2DB|nr:carboxyl-terminal processing protease CtpA [Xenococcus sp. PCC 7305]ELS01661.1 C-terminal processing peptidase [Xenococcus sp. PCC 7305]